MVTGKKEFIIAAFEKVGQPLTEVQIKCLHDVERELTQHGMSPLFAIIDVECRVCSQRQSCLVPAVSDLDNLQCDNCGNLSCQEVRAEEYPEEPDATTHPR